MTDICICGERASSVLRMHYRIPRRAPELMADDPLYCHGFQPLRTCGATACEASSYMAFLLEHPGADIHLGDDFEFGYLIDDEEGAP